jgi:transposase-like protein
MHTIEAITGFVRWLCGKLTRDELTTAAGIIDAVLKDERDDIRPRNDFEEKHPNYRQFNVDPDPPLTAPPPIPEPETFDYRELIAEHQQKTGKTLKPVSRRAGSHRPPPGATCERCSAPAQFLYVNDGKKASQLRCKVCDHLFASQRCRHETVAKYWCPHCNWALYRWKHDQNLTSYKCSNDHCPCYLRNRERLNKRERKLLETGMSSQFKLRYQYREYHFTPADLETARPEQSSTVDLRRIQKHYSTVGLALAYNISFGMSSRMTAQILKRVHQIDITYQTVLNYVEAAAVLADRFTRAHLGPLTDDQLAGDETYIRVGGEWNYTWLVIGGSSRAIRAYHLSDQRDTLAATATLGMAVEPLSQPLEFPIEFVGDGNPSYDAAVHVINADSDGKPLQRRTVIGLQNLDEESEQYRPFKQLIERLNRTYKFHTRARSGFKSQQGAVALTALFVAYYNFLRPHHTLHQRTPIHVAELHEPATLQGQWLKLLQLAA